MPSFYKQNLKTKKNRRINIAKLPNFEKIFQDKIFIFLTNFIVVIFTVNLNETASRIIVYK